MRNIRHNIRYTIMYSLLVDGSHTYNNKQLFNLMTLNI